MFFRRPLLTLAFAVAAFGFAQATYALCPLSCKATYDDTTPTKEAPDTDLECAGPILIQVGGLPGSGSVRSFEASSEPGALSCVERDKTSKEVVTGPFNATLKQEQLFPTDQLDRGLVLEEGLENGKKTFTYKFVIDGANNTGEVALWTVTPVGAPADVCGDLGDDCKSWRGTPVNPSAADFPDGVVFTFKMIEDNGKLISDTYTTDYCHNGSWDGSLKNNGSLVNPIVCQEKGKNGLKFVGSATATVNIALDVDIQPGQDPNAVCKSSPGNLSVAVLSRKEGGEVAVNPATIDADNVTLDGVKASGGWNLDSDYNIDGIQDLTLIYNIQDDLLAEDGGSSLLKAASLGDIVTLPVVAPSTVGNTSFIGEDAVTIGVCADYRAGCNTQISLQGNISGTDWWAIAGDADVDPSQIATQNTVPTGVVKLGGVVSTDPAITDVTGAYVCGLTTDGEADGTNDLRLKVDLAQLYLANKTVFDQANDGDMVNLLVEATLLDDTPIVGIATVTVHK